MGTTPIKRTASTFRTLFEVGNIKKFIYRIKLTYLKSFNFQHSETAIQLDLLNEMNACAREGFVLVSIGR